MGPFLEKYLEMPIWHPMCEKTLDALLDAQLDVLVYHSLIQCLSCCDSLLFWSQILCKGIIRQEDADSEKEHCSFDRRHVLEYGVQDGETGRQGSIIHMISIIIIIYIMPIKYNCMCEIVGVGAQFF